jgi:glycosyltransferase involved in cell wall biosynthesis
MDIKDSGVICNPLNISNLDYVEYPTNEIFNFASVARLEINFKGQDVLFQVLSQEPWRNRDWILNLYGKGPDEEYLRNLAAFYQIESKVSFKGHVDDVKDIWRENQILLMPSLGEGTPLALLEATICGRTAVVSDVGGNAEVIENMVTGFIADAPTPNSFGRVLEKAWEKRLSWQQMGLTARQKGLLKIDLEPDKTLLKVLVQKK